MFQSSINRIDQFFCDLTNFKKLPNQGFDDRHVDNGYFIQDTNGITNFSEFAGNKRLQASKQFDIFIQYRNEFKYDLIAGLLNLFSCSGELVVSLNENSVEVYGETSQNKLQENGFSFAKITVELKDFVNPKDCFIC